MVSVMILPASSVVNVFLIQWMPALVIGGLTVSAILSGWLKRHQRIERYVTALAMASLLALSIYSAAHPRTMPFRTSPIIDCGLFWWDPMCWLF